MIIVFIRRLCIKHPRVTETLHKINYCWNPSAARYIYDVIVHLSLSPGYDIIKLHRTDPLTLKNT